MTTLRICFAFAFKIAIPLKGCNATFVLVHGTGRGCGQEGRCTRVMETCLNGCQLNTAT
ncbi:hypothetical protein LEMLEM_LOCUS15730 [Lemmus lemmus]